MAPASPLRAVRSVTRLEAKGEDVKKEDIGQGDQPSYVNAAIPALHTPAAAYSKGSGGKGVASAGIGILEGYQEESGEDE